MSAVRKGRPLLCRAPDGPRAGGFVVAHIDDPGGLADELTALEPRTSAVVSLLRARGAGRRRHRVVTRSDGSVAAVVAFRRPCVDAWTASVHLGDPAAAAVVADLVDRSPARSVSGRSVDALPLLEHSRRALGSAIAPRFTAPHPVDGIVEPPDDRTRVARRSDLDALVELYRTYELVPVPTVWQLRRFLRATLDDDTIIVALDGDDLIGAGVLTFRTDRFLTLTNLVVDPAHRGRGLSWELIKRTGQVAVDAEVGASMALAPTNPMSFEHERVARSSETDEHHCSIALGNRWRGQTRVRGWISRLDRVRPRQVELYRDVTDPDRPAV